MFASNMVKTLVMVITPELAQKMLNTSTGNRRIRNSHVVMLAGSMQRGEWRLTNQGIAFSKSGVLKDGHHRLTACIKSGVTLEMLVTFGLDDEAYKAIDIGLKRSYSDVLNVNQKTVEILTLGLRIANGSKNPTPQQVSEYFETDFMFYAKELNEHCGTNKRVVSSVTVKLAAVINMLEGADKEYVKTQYKALVLQDYAAMSQISQAFIRQVNDIKLTGSERGPLLVKALKTFDPERANQTRIGATDAEVIDAFARVKSTILGIEL